MTVFRTPPGDASVHPAGWYPLPSGREIVRLPLADRRYRLTSGEPLTARLDYAGLSSWCALTGTRMATPDEIEEIARVGLVLPPVTLGAKGAPASLEAAIEHDEQTEQARKSAGWAHGVPVLCGKAWVRGAPAGRSWLMGWPVEELGRYSATRRGPGWVQPRPAPGSLGPHDDWHVDYSSVSYVTREHRPGWLDRIREDADEILDRGLASFARPAELAPHGWRCSVTELVQDARKLGTWRDRGPPSVGWLAISGRAGGDPRAGGTGHVERVTRIEPGEVWTIGGNELNTWIEDRFRALPLGWIAYPAGLGARCVELARIELVSSVREVPGPRVNPRIQTYHAGASRGGGPRAGMPGDTTGAPLGLASDEIPWCASSASWCLYQALLG